MRIRLWSVFILAGLIIGAFLTRAGSGRECPPPPAIPSCPPPSGTALPPLPGCEVITPIAPATMQVVEPLPPPKPCIKKSELIGCKPSVIAPMPTPVKQAAQPPTMMVNSRCIRLNFNIADVGPSGVSSVELWCTRDGQTWQRYSSAPPPNGPLVVHVAEEGRYGFSLVVKNGVGLSSSPPQTGDAPQLWVEVDETKPHVRMLHAEQGKGAEEDCLTLTWTASDLNLMPKPVTISTAASKDGPWTPVSSNLENNGKYVWHMPKDVPYQFFVRVEIADRAGNRAIDCWPEAIKVDRVRPHGVILGIDSGKKPETKSAAGESGGGTSLQSIRWEW